MTTQQPTDTQHIGEIVAVESLTKYIMQKISNDTTIRLGDFIIVDDLGIIGVVGDQVVQNPELGIYPRPKRLPAEVSIDQVYPDLTDQYPTLTTIYVLGRLTSNDTQEIPRQPPAIYDKVHMATTDQIQQFHGINGRPVLNYLIRLQNDDQSAVMDTLIRQILRNLATIFDFDLDTLLEVMS